MSPDKPHILFISSWWPTVETSSGTFVELHLVALQSRNCRCAMMLNGEITLGNYLASGFRSRNFNKFRRRSDITFIENLTVHKSPLRWAKNPLDRRKKNILKQAKHNLSRYIEKNGKPDVIFHHGVFDYAYLTKFVSEDFGMPVWYMENSPNLSAKLWPCANPFDSKREMRAFARECERRFAVTEAYVAKMKALFDVPFECCPNVITDDFFSDPAAFNRESGVFHFANIAILNERKNQKGLIEAFAKAFKGDQTCKLFIAGDGPLHQALVAKATACGVADQVEILGFLDRAAIVALLDRVHSFVLNSHAETFGVVIIEAMARGIPAVSTNIDGPSEIVNSENGILCEVDNVDSLASAMIEMRTRYDQFDPEVIIRSVKERFGPDAVKQALFTKDE